MISNGTAPSATISTSSWISSIVPECIFKPIELAIDLKPKKVIFNPPATVVYWNDGTKTVVKCKDGTVFDEWTGLAMATSKRIYGDKFKSVFKKWCSNNYETTEPIIFVNVNDSLEVAMKTFKRKFLEIKNKYGSK